MRGKNTDPQVSLSDTENIECYAAWKEFVTWAVFLVLKLLCP